MATETNVGAQVLPPRAAIALLTLQLRGIQQEITATEARAEAYDVDAELAVVRARLAPLVEERRKAVDAEIDQARRAAAAAVAAAHAELGMARGLVPIVVTVEREFAAGPESGQPAQRAPEPAGEVEPDVVVVTDPFGVVEPTTVVPAEPTTTSLPTIVEATPVAESPSDLTDWSAPVDPPPPPRSSGTSTVVIDADSFARAFAAVLAPILEARGQVAPPEPYYRVVPAPIPAKRSFWSHAWHPDVLLSLVAMIIVLVVLVAWTA